MMVSFLGLRLTFASSLALLETARTMVRSYVDSWQEPLAGPPYRPQIWALGGIPDKHIDIPVSAVFIFLFLCGAATHMTIFQVNRRRGHKFLFNLFLFSRSSQYSKLYKCHELSTTSILHGPYSHQHPSHSLDLPPLKHQSRHCRLHFRRCGRPHHLHHQSLLRPTNLTRHAPAHRMAPCRFDCLQNSLRACRMHVSYRHHSHRPKFLHTEASNSDYRSRLTIIRKYLLSNSFILTNSYRRRRTRHTPTIRARKV